MARMVYGLLVLGCATAVSAQELFFSAQAEGSSHNKYLEVFNPKCTPVALSDYAIRSVTNGGEDFEHDLAFDEGARIPAGGTWVICDPRADPSVLANCDQQYGLLSNGDDAFALASADGTILDIIGDIGADPGAGWPVAGLEHATKDHTIVRKPTVMAGNGGSWEASAGTNEADTEWIVLDRNVWWPVQSRACERGCTVGDCVGAPPGPPPPPRPPPPPPPPPSPPPAGDAVAVPPARPLRSSTSLFFSALAEGSSYNKYLEIFNPTCEAIPLDDYSFPTIANGLDDSALAAPYMWEFENVFFPGAVIPAGETFVVCNPQADAAIMANCDQVFQYLGNGNDAVGLVRHGADGVDILIDLIGEIGPDPGAAGWAVAGVDGATRDHTLVRVDGVKVGNGGMWASSAGISEADSEWLVLDSEEWWPVTNRACERSCTPTGDCEGAPRQTHSRRCEEIQSVAETLTDVCPAANPGEVVPSSCTWECAQIFLPMWRKCSEIRSVLATMEGGDFAAFQAFEEQCVATRVAEAGGH